ncbi:unnamed protein product [Porites evermanni]|uniref:THAP-type domain-containing protein n=1 Tax=Porites evermanni TaxID=104178 RepID=A0ABN8RZK2_9CNID|nr:unnamed protein product [Porites evermanni]
MFRILLVIYNQGEETEELTIMRREKWISAISRDDVKYKDILKSERVCGRHFVSGKPSQRWDKHNVDWAPTSTSGDVEAMELTLTKQNNKKKVWQLVLKHKQKHSIIYIEKLSDRPTRTLKPRQKNLTILSLKVAAIKHQTGNSLKVTRRCVFTQVCLHTKYSW